MNTGTVLLVFEVEHPAPEGSVLPDVSRKESFACDLGLNHALMAVGVFFNSRYGADQPRRTLVNVVEIGKCSVQALRAAGVTYVQ